MSNTATNSKHEPIRIPKENEFFHNREEFMHMDAKVRRLREEAEKRKVEAHGALDTQLRMAEAQLELLRAKMKSAGQKTEAISEEIKTGVQDAWMDLKTSVERASKYLN